MMMLASWVSFLIVTSFGAATPRPRRVLGLLGFLVQMGTVLLGDGAS